MTDAGFPKRSYVVGASHFEGLTVLSAESLAVNPPASGERSRRDPRFPVARFRVSGGRIVP
jgi:hypothetical protein